MTTETQPKLEEFIWVFDNKDGGEDRYFRADKAAAFLLERGVLQLGSVRYILNDWEDQKKWVFSENDIIALRVNCNDVFAWGCSDSEDIDYGHYISEDFGSNELYDLLKLYLEHNRWGPVKWVCRKCDRAPQSPMVKEMIREGVWDEDMQALRHNSIDDICCESHRNIAKENQQTLESS